MDATGRVLLQALAPLGEKGEFGSGLCTRLGWTLDTVSAVAVYLQKLGYVRLRTRGAQVEHAVITVEGVYAMHAAIPAAGVHIHGGNVQIGSSNQQVHTENEEEDAEDDNEVLLVEQRPEIPAHDHWRSELFVLEQDETIRVFTESDGPVDVTLLTKSQLKQFYDDDKENHGYLDNHERVKMTNMFWTASKHTQVHVVVENNGKRAVEVEIQIGLIPDGNE